MNSIDFYLKLPYWGKVLASSWHGLRLKRWRYGGIYECEFHEAGEREKWSPLRLQEYQAIQLANILRIALTDVPWYQEQVPIDPQSINSENAHEKLFKFPILEKEQVRADPKRFLNQRYQISDLYEEHTSGTTGTPLRIYWSREMVQRWYALAHRRWLGWVGVSAVDRWALFGGQLVADITRTSPPFWVRNWSMHQCYFSSYHIAPNYVSAYLYELQRFRPRYIMGYPSALVSLVSLSRDIGLIWKGPPIKVIIGNAEPFYQWQRERVEGFFGCPSVDTYGSAEGIFMGVECSRKHIHLCPDVGVWEIFGNDGKPLPIGQTGEFVCTGLLNDAMPLIRYRTGDDVALSSMDSDCGIPFPILDHIEGRSDDMIILPDGRRIGRLDPIFKADFPICEAQIVQKNLSSVKVLIVPAKGFNSYEAIKILKAVKSRLGNQVEVHLDIVDSIPRTRYGKLQAVISSISS